MPHLLWVGVHHPLADAVQLCCVANKAQVLLLEYLLGRLARRPPHLLEHLRGGSTQEDPSKKQSVNKVAGLFLLTDTQSGTITAPLTDLLGNRRGDTTRFLQFQQLGQSRWRDRAEIKWKGNVITMKLARWKSGDIKWTVGEDSDSFVIWLN